jgi:hypothetical protein
MTLQKDMFKGALLAIAAVTLSACAFDVDSESEEVGEAELAVGDFGHNNVSPEAVDKASVSLPVTNDYSITSPSNPDPLPLCKGGTVTSTGCVLKPEWENWLLDNRHSGNDAVAHSWMMKGIAMCSVESNFTIRTSDNSQTFAGQWPLYPGWKTNRLNGADKRERVSACILALLNGNNATLNICIIGPGGAPFSDACSDPNISLREGGFFGDLFADPPTAYVAGPDTDEVLVNGRVCAASQGTYCCAENDTSCSHKIVLAGAIMGSPEQDFANKRCNAFAATGSFEYCTEYFSTREPGRVYRNVFTTFVPPAP